MRAVQQGFIVHILDILQIQVMLHLVGYTIRVFTTVHANISPIVKKKSSDCTFELNSS